jgi:hypothetical protein
MGANYGILSYEKYPDPYSQESNDENFIDENFIDKKANYLVIHFEDKKNIKSLREYFQDTSVWVASNGQIYDGCLPSGKIKYELRFLSSPKIIDGKEYRMGICIHIFPNFSKSIYYQVRKMIDKKRFVEKITAIGAEWDAKKDILLRQKNILL